MTKKPIKLRKIVAIRLKKTRVIKPWFQKILLTKAIKIGVKDFVVKPFPPERLQKAAEKALS